MRLIDKPMEEIKEELHAAFRRGGLKAAYRKLEAWSRAEEDINTQFALFPCIMKVYIEMEMRRQMPEAYAAGPPDDPSESVAEKLKSGLEDQTP